MVDKGFDTIGGKMDRHVILLTDGDWQKPTTSTILVGYAQQFPSRLLPVIHGVFISDTAAHLAAGFPPQGLTTCSYVRRDSTHMDTVMVPMDLQFLKLAADQSHGMYFPGSTPQTIVATFDSLFKVITVQSVVGLTAVTFTNVTTGEERIASFEADTGSGHFKVSVPAFALQYGINTFKTTMTTKDANGVVYTKTDQFTVNRRLTAGTGTTQVFSTECGIDTVDMAIVCRPRSLLMTEFDTVTAKVDPKDTLVFVPNDVTLRAFVPFADKEDDRTVALFHFDGKNLVNSAPGGQPGSGSPSFSDNAAFGNAISSGSFTTAALGSPLTDNFTFECWINPGNAGQAASIASGAGFSFGVTADGYLTATIGAVTLKTTNAIDKNVWQHVAVARLNGSANLYINGIPMAAAVSATGSLSGALTVGNFSGGALDEVRISGFVKSTQIQGKTILEIPIAQNLQWKIGAATSSLKTATLPAALWQGSPRDEVRFQFSNVYYGPVVINFFDTLSSPQLMWSKNGDPVLFGSNQVIVDATLRDTSHDGHLDLIDITWTDDIAISTTPDPGQFIANLQIKTLDGNKDVTLHAKSIVVDGAKKTMHVVLSENQDQSVLETGWSGATITLNQLRITDDGRWFVLNKIIDDADPIPKSACFGMTPLADTLRITFSEPIEGTTIDLATIVRIDQNAAKSTLASLAPKTTVKSGSLMTLTFNSKTIKALVQSIQEQFPGEPSSPVRVIDYCTGPTGISVEASLKDTSHDGHLDLIDITWSDAITVKSVPNANQLVKTLQITTLDGGKQLTLHASSVVLDSAKKTIHIILAENTDSLVLETGWSSAVITLTEFKLTDDARWLVVDRVRDEAAPIPKSVCYGFTETSDTLNVYFSEPIEGATVDLNNIIRIDHEGKRASLASLGPKNSAKSGNRLTVSYNAKTIQPTQTIEEVFPGERSSPARIIDYCHGGPLIERVPIGPNPFIPGVTLVKPGKYGVFIRLDLFIPSKIAKGSFLIFDAVGNVIADVDAMETEGPYSLSKVWDGKNKRGMYVAGGTYLLRATAENTLTGQQETRKGLIGVKTNKK
jgi:hypothetical protein